MTDSAILELEHVVKEYMMPGSLPPVRVLADVSLSVNPGDSLAIIGPSGCGKSTLLNLLGGLDSPTSGSVRLDGRDLAGLREAELARLRNERVGFVFQLHHLLPQLTVLENVLLPLLARPGGADEAATARAESLLDTVGLAERRGFPPGRLSGGERQRVAVVRALINEPALLLADEPTGALDQASSAALADLLQELNTRSGQTLVMVTHSMEIARRMRRVLRLADGRLEAEA